VCGHAAGIDHADRDEAEYSNGAHPGPG
ncbi:MAG: hypothetical protein ACI9DE_002743, partial [Halioglobus sp.]